MDYEKWGKEIARQEDHNRNVSRRGRGYKWFFDTEKPERRAIIDRASSDEILQTVEGLLGIVRERAENIKREIAIAKAAGSTERASDLGEELTALRDAWNKAIL